MLPASPRAQCRGSGSARRCAQACGTECADKQGSGFTLGFSLLQLGALGALAPAPVPVRRSLTLHPGPRLSYPEGLEGLLTAGRCACRTNTVCWRLESAAPET